MCLQTSPLSNLEVTELALQRIVDTRVVVKYPGRRELLVTFLALKVFFLGVSNSVLFEKTLIFKLLFANFANVQLSVL